MKRTDTIKKGVWDIYGLASQVKSSFFLYFYIVYRFKNRIPYLIEDIPYFIACSMHATPLISRLNSARDSTR